MEGIKEKKRKGRSIGSDRREEEKQRDRSKQNTLHLNR